MLRFFEHVIEVTIFTSRWLLAPFFLGLIAAIVVLLYKFMKELFSLVADILVVDKNEAVITILTLVDFALIASLLVMIILSGYESFVSKIEFGEQSERPVWMGKVGFSDLKLKLIGAIVAISTIELLKTFLQPGAIDQTKLAWQVGIHMAFVVSGVLFALTDWISDKKK